MAVEILAGYGKEAVTGPDGSRVGTGAGERSFAALWAFGLYDSGQLLDRNVFVRLLYGWA
jgi:hypothetical protein